MSYEVKFFSPELNEKQIKLLNEVSSSDQLKVGPRVAEATEMLEDHYKMPALLTSSASAALTYLFLLVRGRVLDLPNRLCPSVLVAARLGARKVRQADRMIDGDKQVLSRDYSVSYNDFYDATSPKVNTSGTILDACQLSPWRVYARVWAMVVSFGPTKMIPGIGGGAILGSVVDDIKADWTEGWQRFLAPNEFQAAAVLGLNFHDLLWEIIDRGYISRIYSNIFEGRGWGGPLWYEVPYDVKLAATLDAAKVETSEFYPGNSERTIALPVDIDMRELALITDCIMEARRS